MNMEEDEDERREAAIASTKTLQPHFKPKRVTQEQLSKLQELHQRRLKIKSKSKLHKKSKGNAKGTSRFHCEDLDSMDHDRDSTTEIKASSAAHMKSHDNNSNSSIQQDNVGAHLAPKKRQKLHWGLDTKERWERKANM